MSYGKTIWPLEVANQRGGLVADIFHVFASTRAVRRIRLTRCILPAWYTNNRTWWWGISRSGRRRGETAGRPRRSGTAPLTTTARWLVMTWF